MESSTGFKIKAVIADKVGGPEVLSVQEVDFPSNDDKPDYVWIKTEATAVNRAECMQRRGRY